MQLRNGKVIQEEKKEETGKKQADKKQPGKDKEEGVKEAPTGSGGGGGATKKQTNKTDPKPKPAPKPAAPVMTTPKKSAAKGVRGLCLGASQKPKNNIKEGVARYRDGSALEAVRQDVKMFRGLLDSHFKADTAGFVGQDKSEWMTKNKFISLLKHNLFEPTPTDGYRPTSYYALYVLYYGGHGGGKNGDFSVEKGEKVTLDDILTVWADSKPYKAETSKLLIVADSCHSGAMVARLRALVTRGGRATREAAAAKTVAIQAACGPKEVAYDGVFTTAYTAHVGKSQRIMQRQLFEVAGFSGLCSTCYDYRRMGCHGCVEVVRKFEEEKWPVPPGCPAEMPRPEFFCPWGGNAIETGPGGKPFPLFKHSG